MTEYVFGPVPSRRLGRSLGVDLVPYKVCTFDCLYCQVGRTTMKTIERAVYVPTDEVLAQVRDKLQRGARPDYITLSGSGEPTLHADLDRIVTEIKAMSDVPLAVLTNGSLMFDPAVRSACAKADLILPSLDAGSETLFRHINRPYAGLTLQRVVDGLATLRHEFTGPIWLEVFLLRGVNAIEAELLKIKALADRIRPDRLQLNTAVRPTAEEYALTVPKEQMEHLCTLMGPKAEVIADFSAVDGEAGFQATADEVLAMLRRRPCTLDDVAGGLSMHRNEAVKYLEDLSAKGLISSQWRGRHEYFQAT